MRFLTVTLMLALTAPVGAQEQPGIDTWFPRLRAGMWVEVDGTLSAPGVVDAKEIKILDSELDEFQIESNVETVDTDRGTLTTTLGVPVVITPKTLMKGPRKSDRISFAFVGVDDRVEIEGKPRQDGTLVADEVEVEKSKKRKPELVPANDHEIRARIETVDAARHQIVLMGFTVNLSDKTRNKSSFVE